jgi:hypothetical protein
MRDLLLDLVLPIIAELVAIGFFLSVVAVWAGIVTGAI